MEKDIKNNAMDICDITRGGAGNADEGTYLMETYIGSNKAPHIAKRKIRDTETIISGNEEAVSFVNLEFNLMHRADEYNYMLCLNSRNALIGVFEVSHGSSSSVDLPIRETLTKALLCGSTSIILIHNHPDGNIDASEEDKDAYTKVKEACDLVGIRLIDMIIVADSKARDYTCVSQYVAREPERGYMWGTLKENEPLVKIDDADIESLVNRGIDIIGNWCASVGSNKAPNDDPDSPYTETIIYTFTIYGEEDPITIPEFGIAKALVSFLAQQHDVADLGCLLRKGDDDMFRIDVDNFTEEDIDNVLQTALFGKKMYT